MQGQGQPRTVLIADDNQELRTLMAEFLTSDGFEVLEASDGVEALEIVRRARPDAVLLDIIMPRLNGLHTLERLREIDPDVQVIIMTAALDPALLRSAIFAGATAVLTKPLSLDDVAAALRWEPCATVQAVLREPAPRPASAAKKVLIVDDELEVRTTIQEILRGNGYDVRTAADGVSALEAVLRDAPDVVLLDVRMPGLNGIDVLASIRAIDADVKVIMLTGVTRQNVANQAFDQGVFDYIGKPVDPAYLELSVATALSDPDTWAPEAPPPSRP